MAGRELKRGIAVVWLYDAGHGRAVIIAPACHRELQYMKITTQIHSMYMGTHREHTHTHTHTFRTSYTQIHLYDAHNNVL